MTRDTRKARIQDLPTELLLHIFSYLYNIHLDNARSILTNSTSDSTSRPTTDLVRAFRDPTSFPYAPARVCHHWMNVLAMNSTFWTNVVLFTNMPLDESMNNAERVLGYSKGLPVRVFISRCPGGSVPSPEVEKEAVRVFLEAVDPYMERCRSLQIDTYNRSALPSILEQRFKARAPLLSSLSLGCEVDDQGEPEHEEAEEEVAKGDEELDSLWNPREWPSNQPALTRLSLDCHNFQRAVSNMDIWESLSQRLQFLTISSPPGSTNAIMSVSQLMEPISHLTTLRILHISHVPLLLSPNGHQTPHWDKTISASFVILEGLTQQTTSEIFHTCVFVLLEQLHLKSCPLLRDSDIPPICARLVLEGYTPHTFHPDAVRHWEGASLAFVDSPCVTDGLLSVLGDFLDGSDSDDATSRARAYVDDAELACPNLFSLVIENCPNFSTKGLRRLVEKRNKRINYENPDWENEGVFPPAIRWLTVVEDKQSTLPSDDRIWFEDHIAEFEWRILPGRT